VWSAACGCDLMDRSGLPEAAGPACRCTAYDLHARLRAIHSRRINQKRVFGESDLALVLFFSTLRNDYYGVHAAWRVMDEDIRHEKKGVRLRLLRRILAGGHAREGYGGAVAVDEC